MSALALSFGLGLGIPCVCITAICFVRIIRSIIYPEHESKPPIAFQSSHLQIPPLAPMQGHNNFIYATSQTFNPPSSHDEPPDFSSVVLAQYPATHDPDPYVIRTMI
jgi:hypothetical protein